MNTSKWRQLLVADVFNLMYEAVKFCWVPAHKGVKGKECVDKLAKNALKKSKNYVILLGTGGEKAVIRRIHKNGGISKYNRSYN